MSTHLAIRAPVYGGTGHLLFGMSGHLVRNFDCIPVPYAGCNYAYRPACTFTYNHYTGPDCTGSIDHTETYNFYTYAYPVNTPCGQCFWSATDGHIDCRFWKDFDSDIWKFRFGIIMSQVPGCTGGALSNCFYEAIATAYKVGGITPNYPFGTYYITVPARCYNDPPTGGSGKITSFSLVNVFP